MADDFCKEFALQQEKYMIEYKKTKHRNKLNRMSDAEIMVILILFHSGGCRCFKHYYKEYVCKHLKHLFPCQVIVLWNQRRKYSFLWLFSSRILLGACTDISFVEFTPLCVCRNQKILIHKTFEGIAGRGKCSMSWLFGFKLHLIINDKGKFFNFMFTPGNVDDRKSLKQSKFLENIKGELCADKVYIGQVLFENFFFNDIQSESDNRTSFHAIRNAVKKGVIDIGRDEFHTCDHSSRKLWLFFRNGKKSSFLCLRIGIC